MGLRPAYRIEVTMSKDAKQIGMLIIGRKRPGFDQEWNQIMCRRAAEALAALGLTAVGAEAPVVDEQTTRAALDRIRASGCEALLVLQPSLGNGQLSLTVAQHWNAPVVLWATPERPDSAKVSSCSLVAQHLRASVLRQVNHPFEIVYGDPAEAVTREELGRAIVLCRTAGSLRRAKVGLVGAHAPGFLAMEADLSVLGRELGVQLHTLSLPQFIDRVHAIEEQRVAADVSRIRAASLPLVNVRADDLPTSSRCYLAMLDLITEEQLDALAVQCWPELPNVLGQWPYLAMSRLTDEGHAIAPEGDVDGALTCLLGTRSGIGVGFITDWLQHDEHSITFWHAGNAPLQLCNPVGSQEGPSLGQHFNVAKPLVVDATLRADMPVTVVRLWRCDDRYHLMAFEGRTKSPGNKLSGNVAQVDIADRNVREWFDELCHAGMPHHVVLFAGRHRDTLRRLARTLRIDWLA